MTTFPLAGRFAALDTATLHESGAPTLLSQEIRMLSGEGCIAGPALTAMCPPGDNLMIHAAVARGKPGEVLVVQCHDPGYGVWGEVLTVAAMARGIAALVIDGSVRDLAAIRKLSFPVFARGTCLRGSVKVAHGSVGAPISCGGQPIIPGDIIAGDESGLVAIQAAEAEAVLARAEERARKEAVMLQALRDGRTTVELLGLAEKLPR